MRILSRFFFRAALILTSLYLFLWAALSLLAGFLLAGLFWLAVGLLLFFIVKYLRWRHRKKFTAFFKSFYCDTYLPAVEYISWKMGMYAGFDTKNGTMLIIGIDGTQKAIKTFSMTDLTAYETLDHKAGAITFKFRDISFPYFQVFFGSNYQFQQFRHQLDALTAHGFWERTYPLGTADAFASFVKEKMQHEKPPHCYI